MIQNAKNKFKVTRRNKHRGTIIDHMITSKQNMCKINVKDVPILDHKMLIFRITLLKNYPNIKTKSITKKT